MANIVPAKPHTPTPAEKARAAVANAPQTTESMTLKALLATTNVRSRFEDMLGKKAAGFISGVLSAVSLNKALSSADPQTILSAAAIAAALDLPINSSLGFAHIVPYKGQAQFQMGWKGFVQLAMRSGQYKTMNVAVVYEGEIKYQDRVTGHMEFDNEGKKSDVIVGYVAYFRLLNGFEKFIYMTKAQAEAHGKRYSQSYGSDNSQWKKNFDAMALKTVIKMLLSKWGILSVEMQKAITFDQAVVSEDEKPTYIDAKASESEIEEKPFIDPQEEGGGTYPAEGLPPETA
jgi:recombination protein RecT